MDFKSFLQEFKVKKSKESKKFTHTSMASPSGCYNIPNEYLDTFYKLYGDEIDKGSTLHITENHLDEKSKIIVDIDLRFSVDDFQRKYTLDHIKNIIRAYTNEIENYMKMDSEFTYYCYVMERDKPRIEKGVTKDGIHLIFDVTTDITFQKFLRTKVITNVKNQGILNDLQPLNEYSDIFDRSIITGLWQLYGSCKPNCKPYKITHVFQKKKNEDAKEIQFGGGKYGLTLTPRSLSIREIDEDKDLEIMDSKKEEMEKEYKKFQKKKKSTNGDSNTAADIFFYKFSDINTIKEYIKLLSVDRATVYQSWIEVGWCLHNIDKSLINDWVEFSKQSEKFEDGKCEELWDSFRDEGLGLGTLHRWAMTDDPVGYEELKSKDITNLVISSISGTNYDIANILYEMYKYNYICVSHKNKSFYEFKNHRWHVLDNAHSLRSRISNELINEYGKVIRNTSEKMIKTTGEEKDMFQTRIKLLNNVIDKLKSTQFKNNVITECAELFYIQNALEKFDSNLDLLGFENGVYDLKNMTFRDGRPVDYI